MYGLRRGARRRSDGAGADGWRPRGAVGAALALSDGNSHQDQHQCEDSTEAEQIGTDEQKSHDVSRVERGCSCEGGGLRVARCPPSSVGIGPGIGLP